MAILLVEPPHNFHEFLVAGLHFQREHLMQGMSCCLPQVARKNVIQALKVRGGWEPATIGKPRGTLMSMGDAGFHHTAVLASWVLWPPWPTASVLGKMSGPPAIRLTFGWEAG